MFKASRFKIVIILVMGALSFPLMASPADSLLNGLTISPKVRYGFIYPHHSSIAYILEGNIKSFELTLSTSANGRHIYEDLYRSPGYGLGYNYLDFSNPDVLGRAHAIFGFFEAPFCRNTHKLNFLYQISLGCGYINQVFDSDNNPLNLAISSHVNIYVGFGTHMRYRINQRNHLNLGLEASHYSNGKLKSPNLGLNTVLTSFAWMYDLTPSKEVDYSGLSRNFNKHFIDLNLNMGLKRDDMLNEYVYQTASFISDYWYGFVPKYAVGAGFDFFYDESLGPTKVAEEEIPAIPADNYQAGLHLGLMAQYNRFALYLNTGMYVWANYQKYSTAYNRLGLRYTLNNRINLNLSIKAHYAIADFVEWGVGYRFELKHD